jgi:hypothetical protein
MKPHPRIRKTIKWGGAAVTVLLVAVWIGCGWWVAGYRANQLVVSLEPGVVVVISGPYLSDPLSMGWYAIPRGEFTHWTWGFVNASTPESRVLFFPVWLFVAATLVPSAAAWRLDTLARRRAKLNLCAKCGYDRTGLRGGIGAKCPECGTVPASE